jgi:hypothetical protein
MPQEAKSEIDSPYWLKTITDKAKQLKIFHKVYESDLKGLPNTTKVPWQPKTDDRIAEKHIALAVMNVVCNESEYSIIPIGRPQEYTDGRVILEESCPAAPDKLPPDATTNKLKVRAKENGGINISRFEAVIVHDNSTGGECIINFGAGGCKLMHSGKDFSEKNEDVESHPSFVLARKIYLAVLLDLKSQEHRNLYPRFDELTQLAEEAVRDYLLSSGHVFAAVPVIKKEKSIESKDTQEDAPADLKSLLAKDIVRSKSGLSRCEIISMASMDKFSDDVMNENEAYIRCGNELYYRNKMKVGIVNIPADETMFSLFDQYLKITSFTHRVLSDEELRNLKQKQYIHHNQSKRQLIISAIPLISEEKDMRLAFGNRLGCSMTILAKAAPQLTNVTPVKQHNVRQSSATSFSEGLTSIGPRTEQALTVQGSELPSLSTAQGTTLSSPRLFVAGGRRPPVVQLEHAQSTAQGPTQSSPRLFVAGGRPSVVQLEHAQSTAQEQPQSSLKKPVKENGMSKSTSIQRSK